MQKIHEYFSSLNILFNMGWMSLVLDANMLKVVAKVCLQTIEINRAVNQV